MFFLSFDRNLLSRILLTVYVYDSLWKILLHIDYRYRSLLYINFSSFSLFLTLSSLPSLFPIFSFYCSSSRYLSVQYFALFLSIFLRWPTFLLLHSLTVDLTPISALLFNVVVISSTRHAHTGTSRKWDKRRPTKNDKSTKNENEKRVWAMDLETQRIIKLTWISEVGNSFLYKYIYTVIDICRGTFRWNDSHASRNCWWKEKWIHGLKTARTSRDCESRRGKKGKGRKE